MMGLTKHQFDLLLRYAERLKRLSEVNVHEILEQSVVHTNCPDEQFIGEQRISSVPGVWLLFFAMGFCLSKYDSPSMLEVP